MFLCVIRLSLFIIIGTVALFVFVAPAGQLSEYTVVNAAYIIMIYPSP